VGIDCVVVGGTVVNSDSAEEGLSDGISGAGADAVGVRNGVLLVGPGLTKLVMSSGMFVGVTFSINCHDGRSSTIEL